MGNRLRKSIINAEVNVVFYFLALFLSFYSRKIFLNYLGPDFIGLSGTLSNILGYLNLAELGIGASISYHLFKPLQCDDKKKINDIISLFGYLYSKIGLIILVTGLCISLSFPFIFQNSNISIVLVFYSFYAILSSALIGYFINYREILLNADQKKYLVTVYYQSSGLIKTIIQIYLAYKYGNPYYWVTVEFIFAIIGCIILNWRINKEYPWLKSEKNKGKTLIKSYGEIITKTKQVFIHKIKDFILTQSDQLFVFFFVSLKMVAFYGNYTLIISKIGQFFSAVLDSVVASVGNLIAEGNKEQIKKIFWELMTLRHLVACTICFCIFHFIEPFITLWLGSEYVLSKNILILLVIYQYISGSRGAVDAFNLAHGLYGDTWAAWTELAINVSVTIIAGFYWGIVGILLGKIVSTFLIIVIWKPYYLFTDGLHLPIVEYWKGALRNFLVSIVSFFTAHQIHKYLPYTSPENYLQWCINSALSAIIFLIIITTLAFFFCKGFKDLLNRFNYIFISKLHKRINNT
ncbi:MAG: sugar transporter [Bacteroidaceae bacterium]|nr:sugar transporter [Bacteroidaceae bacterium]